MRTLLFRKRFLLLATAALIAVAGWHVARQAPAATAKEKTAMGAFIAKACTLKTWDFFDWWSKDVSTDASKKASKDTSKTQSVTAKTTEEIRVPVSQEATPKAMPDIVSASQNTIGASAIEQFPLVTERSTTGIPPVLVSRPELLLPKYAKPAAPTAVVTDPTDKNQVEKAKTPSVVSPPKGKSMSDAKQSAAVSTQTSTAAPATVKTPTNDAPERSNKPASNNGKTASQNNSPKRAARVQTPKRDQLFTKIVDAYTYAYPLVLMNEIQKEMTDSVFFAPVNQMAYVPVLPGPRLRATECPNVDALTSLVWFDLEKEPQVILLPQKPGHAYILELLDAWTNVIDSFGQGKAESFPTRQYNGHDVKYFVLCGPKCELKFPKDMPVIKSPTNSVWLINRVLLGPPRADGSPDIASAARTLYEFDVLSWSSFSKMISDASRSDAQTRLLHYLNAQSQSRYASSPMQLPMILNTDFSILNDNAFDLTDTTPTKPVTKASSKPDDKTCPKLDKSKVGKTETAPVPKRTDTTAPTDKAEIAAETKEIDTATQAVEKDVTEQTQEAIQSDTPSTEEVELEIDDDMSSPPTTTHVIWQTYRTRRGYVRYAQPVTVPSTPIDRVGNTVKKSTGIEHDIAHEIREVTDEIKAVPAEVSHAAKQMEQRVDSMEHRVATDAKDAETSTRRIVLSTGKDAKTDVDDAMNRTQQISSDLMKYIKGVWLRTKDYSKEGLEYGKDAIDYFDRKAKRDYRHLEQVWADFADSHKWRQRPEARVNEMTPIEFFTEFAELIKKNPPAAADAEMIAVLSELGIKPEQSFDTEKIDTKVLQAMQFAVPFARGKLRQSAVYGMFREPQQNNWIIFRNFGQYGTDYLRRAVVANEFMGADVETEILYPFTFFDADGKLLDGHNDYILHFPAGATPPTEVLWSVTLYDSDHCLTPNRWKRYAVRSNMPLVYNPDGSLDIMIQHKTPELLTSNWLPAPEGPFMLMMRIYRPDASVLSGQWKIPGVTVRTKK